MSEPIIRLTSATKLFKDAKGGKFKALSEIDLSVSRNEFITLLGPSGCGKTTLLNAVGRAKLDLLQARLIGAM